MNMRVYHFTSAKYAVEDIQNQRLKIARINELNDPFELLAADLLDKRDRQAFAKFKNQMNEKFGIVCFSGSWESPLLWGHYADRHMGIALGFDVADEKLIEVNYTTMRPKVKFDQQTRKVINGLQVLDRLIRTKFNEWQYENEYRMYAQLDKAEQKDNRPKLDGKTKESVRRPAFELHELRALLKLLGPYIESGRTRDVRDVVKSCETTLRCW
jgi:hypothetical protein